MSFNTSSARQIQGKKKKLNLVKAWQGYRAEGIFIYLYTALGMYFGGKYHFLVKLRLGISIND